MIKINPKHRGLFTRWCKKHGYKGVSDDCIRKAIQTAKRIGSTVLKKRAVFAKNAKKWGGRR